MNNKFDASRPPQGKLRRAMQFSLGQWQDIIRATVELALARFHLSSKTPIELLALAGTRGQPTLALPPPEQLEIVVDRVSWAIPAMAGVVPWRSDCFVQALAAKHWLLRSEIASELYIGVRKQKATTFEAHAWLRQSDRTVTGGDFSTYIPLAGPETWKGLNDRLPERVD